MFENIRLSKENNRDIFFGEDEEEPKFGKKVDMDSVEGIAVLNKEFYIVLKNKSRAMKVGMDFASECVNELIGRDMGEMFKDLEESSNLTIMASHWSELNSGELKMMWPVVEDC